MSSLNHEREVPDATPGPVGGELCKHELYTEPEDSDEGCDEEKQEKIADIHVVKQELGVKFLPADLSSFRPPKGTKEGKLQYPEDHAHYTEYEGTLGLSSNVLVAQGPGRVVFKHGGCFEGFFECGAALVRIYC